MSASRPTASGSSWRRNSPTRRVSSGLDHILAPQCRKSYPQKPEIHDVRVQAVDDQPNDRRLTGDNKPPGKAPVRPAEREHSNNEERSDGQGSEKARLGQRAEQRGMGVADAIVLVNASVVGGPRRQCMKPVQAEAGPGALEEGA